MKVYNTVIMYFCFCFALELSAQQLPANRNITLPDGTVMAFIFIEPGKFIMGSSSDEQDRHGDEDPVRKVTISKGFFLGRYEVTQSQYLTLMRDNPSIFTDRPDWKVHPVDNVSWNDCQVFIERLNAMDIGTFRLPTEAEWEYACRAGTTTRYYWGEDPNNREIHDYAWGFSRAEGRSHPVGLKKPNAWGLYDMSGNMWEWCADWREPYLESDTLDPRGSLQGTRKIYRGGSWFNEPPALRCANRNGHPPDTKGPNSGFRLVMEITN